MFTKPDKDFVFTSPDPEIVCTNLDVAYGPQFVFTSLGKDFNTNSTATSNITTTTATSTTSTATTTIATTTTTNIDNKRYLHGSEIRVKRYLVKNPSPNSVNLLI